MPHCLVVEIDSVDGDHAEQDCPVSGRQTDHTLFLRNSNTEKYFVGYESWNTSM